MQVILATKYIVQKESTRDHVDLLLSSQCWPTVYAVDMACDVVAHMEVREPQLASAMWGDRRGCFEVPSASTPPKVSYIHKSVSGLIIFTYKTCLHLQIIHVQELKSPHSLPTPSDVALRDHTYCRQVLHPLTQMTDRYIVGDRFHDGPRTSGHKKPTCTFHNMRLCPEVTQYQSVVSEVINSKIKTVRLQSSSQQNIQHYFFYNRLMDYWHNKTIITKQLQQMKAKLQQGETVVRDRLYRFVYACSLCKTPGHTQHTCPQLPDYMSPQ